MKDFFFTGRRAFPLQDRSGPGVGDVQGIAFKLRRYRGGDHRAGAPSQSGGQSGTGEETIRQLQSWPETRIRTPLASQSPLTKV